MPTLPAGWKLVPIEPTDEMETAAEDDYEQRGETFPGWKSAYAAMLAAAPTAPASAQDDAKDAARWRAFVGCARIRPLGSAGLEQPEPNHYAHMGLEIWTRYGRDYSAPLLKEMDDQNERARRWLVMFADVAIAASQQQEG